MTDTISKNTAFHKCNISSFNVSNFYLKNIFKIQTEYLSVCLTIGYTSSDKSYIYKSECLPRYELMNP